MLLTFLHFLVSVIYIANIFLEMVLTGLAKQENWISSLIPKLPQDYIKNVPLTFFVIFKPCKTFPRELLP